MKLGNELAALLLEMNVVNKEDAERRIRILAARLHDTRAAQWFLRAGRHAINNMDQIVDQPHNPEPKPWWRQDAYAETGTPFGPTDPSEVPAGKLSKNLLAMLYSRGPQGDKRPAWWQSHEPAPEPNPAFTHGREAPPIEGDDDPRLQGMSPEDRERYKEWHRNVHTAKRLSDLEPTDIRYQRHQQKQAELARQRAEREEQERLRREQGAARKAQYQGGKGPSVREHIENLVTEAAEITDDVPPEEKIARLHRVLKQVNAIGDAKPGERPNLFNVSGQFKTLLTPQGREALRKAGFVIDSPRPVDGALTVRFQPQYQTSLHKPQWQAMTQHNLSLAQVLTRLKIKATISRGEGGTDDQYLLLLNGKSVNSAKARLSSQEGRELLAQSGYILDHTREEVPDGAVAVRRISPEFAPYKGSKLKDYRYGTQPPTKGWKEVKAPTWASKAAAGEGEAAFFNPLRADEREFWRKMEALVLYLNRLYRDAKNKTDAASGVNAAKAEAVLNSLISANPTDTDKFLSMLADAQAFTSSIPGLVAANRRNDAVQVVSEHGPFKLVKLTTPEAVYNYSRQPSRWNNGQAPGWCTGWEGTGMSNATSYLARGKGRMYVVLKEGDPYALLTPGYAFNDVLNTAGMGADYFLEFAPLFDAFNPSFFTVNPTGQVVNMQNFSNAIQQRRQQRQQANA